MRTTIRMNEELARRAKQYAHREGRTFTDLVEQAINEFLERPHAAKPRKRIVLPVAGFAAGRKFTEAEYKQMLAKMDEEEVQRITRDME